MAMIKCPECGKEISDRAEKCPNCGCPISSMDTQKTNENPGKKINAKIMIIVVMAILIIAALAVFVVNNMRKKAKAEQEKNNYESAVAKVKSGDYSGAVDMFNELGEYEESKKYSEYSKALLKCLDGDYNGGYNDLVALKGFYNTDIVLGQLYYESRLFDGLSRAIEDDSFAKKLTVKEVDVFVLEDSVEANMDMIADVSGEENHFLFMRESDDSPTYILFGSCTSLNVDDYGEDDLEGMIVAKFITACREDGDYRNDLMDLERVNRIIQSGNYKSIRALY